MDFDYYRDSRSIAREMSLADAMNADAGGII